MTQTTEQWVQFGKKFGWCLMDSWPKYAPVNLIPKKRLLEWRWGKCNSQNLPDYENLFNVLDAH